MQKSRALIKESVEICIVERLLQKDCNDMIEKAIIADRFNSKEDEQENIRLIAEKIINPQKNMLKEAGKYLAEGLIKQIINQNGEFFDKTEARVRRYCNSDHIGQKSNIDWVKWIEYAGTSANTLINIYQIKDLINKFYETFLKELRSANKFIPSIEHRIVLQCSKETKLEKSDIKFFLRNNNITQNDETININIINNIINCI